MKLSHFVMFGLSLTLAGASLGCAEPYEPYEPEESDDTEEVVETDQAVCSPYVSYVTPISAKLNTTTTFYVVGGCLPSTTAFWIADCANVQQLGWSPSQVAFSCKPSWTTGLKPGVVKDQPGGIALKNFNVQVKP